MAKSYGKIYQHKNNVSITPTDVYNLYPVGSIYLSVNSTNPSNYFGGTWEKLSGGYLYATGSDVLGKTPYTGWGAQSTALTIAQMPSHNHSMYRPVWYGVEMGVNDGTIFGQTSTTTKTVTSIKSIEFTGGGQGHTHNIATIDVWMWKRVA